MSDPFADSKDSAEPDPPESNSEDLTIDDLAGDDEAGSTDEAAAGETSAEQATAADKKPASTGDKVRTVVRGVGQTLISLGVVVLLFVVYEVYITDLFTAQKQEALVEQIDKDWKEDAPTVAAPDAKPGESFADVAIGDGLAKIRIPAFGSDYVKVVVQGTGDAELEEGPGHYPTTALPGEIGNFAVAGHRVGKGSPFLNLDKLMPGDAIVIETRENWYVYRIVGQKGTDKFDDGKTPFPGRQIVPPTDGNVLLPVPNNPDVKATQKLITLTTCHPKFSAAERMIIHGVLDGSPLPKSKYPKPGDVPALKGN